MDKIKKKIKLFRLLEKLKKRDLYYHLNNVNLLNEELEKTNKLLSKINNIIQEYGLRLFDIEHTKTHGGSNRYYICKKNGKYFIKLT